LIPKGAAFFSCRTGAPIVPTFLTPDGRGNYTLEFGEPILPPEDVQESSMLELMKRYVTVIERKIKEDPTQWLMFREFGIEFENLYSHSRA
jgi:lauroyl/myristoyl acyltransferase